ncbi:MAG TPA: signal peptidase II [Myxococcales bacterium]|nr:signal peptidase II [Myxococcales bacterium]
MSSEAELPQPARGAPPALVALFAPDSGMERQARVGKAGLAVAIALACSLFAAFGHALRVDARSATLQKLDAAGQLTSMSDRAIEDETRNAERLFQVMRVAWGALETPVLLLLGALAVVVLVWFLRGRVKGRAVFPVAAAVLLPGAIANLLDGITALRHESLPAGPALLTPRNVSAIFAAFGHTLSGAALKLGNVVDFFSLWAAVLMAFGVAAAGDVPAKRALIGTLCAWLCLRLVVSVAMGG